MSGRKSKHTERKTHTNKYAECRILLKFVNEIYDDFWKKKFESMSNGNLLPRFIIIDSIMYFAKNTPEEKIIDLTKCDADNCVNFIKNYSNIVSPKDYETYRENQVVKLIDTWAKVKKKDKSTQLTIFVDKYASENRLSERKCNILKNFVTQCNLEKVFSVKNIVVRNGNILEIKGLEFNNDTKNFFINEQFIKNKKRENILYNNYSSDGESNSKYQVKHLNVSMIKFNKSFAKKLKKREANHI